MKLILVRQAIVVPLAAMLTPILIAFTLPGYSSMSQHISEVALLDHPIAIVQRCAATVTGLSILLFGIGLVLLAPGSFRFTAVAATAFAASMISNGLVVMGSPLHGLFGLGLFMVLVPAFFAAELPQEWHGQRIRSLSMLAALLNLVYMWLILSDLEPAKFTGLMQRVATVLPQLPDTYAHGDGRNIVNPLSGIACVYYGSGLTAKNESLRWNIARVDILRCDQHERSNRVWTI